MRISKRHLRTAAIVLAVTLGGGGSLAYSFEMVNATPTDAFRHGFTAYKDGDSRSAFEALRYAAEHKHPAAMWKLGKMYADGDGTAQDDVQAFAMFYEIANSYADENPRTANSRFVANAFVALGDYYARGLSDGSVKPDPVMAHSLYTHAAYYFHDREAQYRLGLAFLNGQGCEKNERQAARLFKLAAMKRHPLATAQLGRLLIKGGEGFRRDTTQGLMWLTIARKLNQEDRELLDIQAAAYEAASQNEREIAIAGADDWLTRGNGETVQ